MEHSRDRASEMATKSRPLSLFAPAQQPSLQRRENYFDFDFDDGQSDSGSEFEEDSPRGSFDSFGARSLETVSTLDQPPTPRSSQKPFSDPSIRRTFSTQGPRGPHLFRSSSDSIFPSEDEIALQLSPVVSKPPPANTFVQKQHLVVSPSATPKPFYTQPPAKVELDEGDVTSWTPEQVASWIMSVGLEPEVADRFIENDINGAVLLDLKLEDLRELQIPSFGKRHQIWKELRNLRQEEVTSPAPTIIDDSSRPGTRPKRSASARAPQARAMDVAECEDDIETPITAGGLRRRRVRKNWTSTTDIVTPAESVSIVAIEQLLPKPHKCSKGIHCAKWKKQQRLREELNEEYDFPISPTKGGEIFIAGDMARLLHSGPAPDSPLPGSEAIPSVVASSDLLGPGQLPEFSLNEQQVCKIGRRDAKESVKQFLNFQHVQGPVSEPPTPPLETPRFYMSPLTPALHPSPATPLLNLQTLPKLTIPSKPESPDPTIRPATAGAVDGSALAQDATPLRRGTPASEMDMPIITLETPISRDISQSVPPNMRFRRPTSHRGSRDASQWRRKSFALPTVSETPTESGRVAKTPVREQSKYGPSTTYAGFMKKRRTRLLRHEWAEHHYRLKGTRLARHASEQPEDQKELDAIDVDDYAVACSSLASNSKLSAALKSLKLSASKKDGVADDTAFQFQLVPTGDKAKLLRMVSDGKTHNFAVKSREDRIDWMREVMLAKAVKQKGDGFEITINGKQV